MKSKRLFILLVSICTLLILAVMPIMSACAKPTPAPSPKPEPIVLNAVTFLRPDDPTNRPFFAFIDKVNERSNGELVIKYAGGPEVIASLEQMGALIDGTIDVLINPDAWLEPQMPGTPYLLKLIKFHGPEQREKGIYDFLVEEHEKVGIRYLMNIARPLNFFIYPNVPVEKRGDLAGLKIAVTPDFIPFIEAWGAVPTVIPPTDYYTSMERGVVDAIEWPVSGLVPWGWHEVCKYIISHPFWGGDAVILMNLDSWNRLPEHLKQLVADVSVEIELEDVAFREKVVVEAYQELVDYGLEPLYFSEADAQWYVDTVYDVSWEVHVRQKVSEDIYQKMRELAARGEQRPPLYWPPR